jgi:hypothetical protein
MLAAAEAVDFEITVAVAFDAHRSAVAGLDRIGVFDGDVGVRQRAAVGVFEYAAQASLAGRTAADGFTVRRWHTVAATGRSGASQPILRRRVRIGGLAAAILVFVPSSRSEVIRGFVSFLRQLVEDAATRQSGEDRDGQKECPATRHWRTAGRVWESIPTCGPTVKLILEDDGIRTASAFAKLARNRADYHSNAVGVAIAGAEGYSGCSGPSVDAANRLTYRDHSGIASTPSG